MRPETLRPVYIAYPSSLTLTAANAIQTFQTVRALRRHHPDLVTLIPRLPGRPSAFGEIGATHLLRLPFNALNHLLRTSLWSYLERSWFAARSALWLAQHQRRGPGTVVYCRDVVVAAWYGALWRRLLGIRLVYEVHDLEQWNPSRARSSLLTPLVRLIDSAAIRGSDRVVTLTDDFRRYLAEVNLKPLTETSVIPDGFDELTFQPADQTAARAELGLPMTALIAVYSGFTFRYRQLDRLITAWAEVQRQHPTATLYLAGGRPADIAELERQAADLGLLASIRFTGIQPSAVVARYLAAADLLVIPGTVSGRNASPLKMFEYMAMERAIVAIDSPALREILGDDGAYFVPGGEVFALATALLALANDPRQRATLAARAVARVQRYTYTARGAAVAAAMRLAMASPTATEADDVSGDGQGEIMPTRSDTTTR